MFSKNFYLNNKKVDHKFIYGSDFNKNYKIKWINKANKINFLVFKIKFTIFKIFLINKIIHAFNK